MIGKIQISIVFSYQKKILDYIPKTTDKIHFLRFLKKQKTKKTIIYWQLNEKSVFLWQYFRRASNAL